MPFRNLLGLGRSSGERVEQEEATQNSVSSLLVEEAFSFFQGEYFGYSFALLKRDSLPKKGTLRSSLAEFEERINSSSLTLTPSYKAMRLLVTYLNKEGKELKRKSMEGEV